MQPSEELRKALIAVFRARNEDATEQQEHDFVFHLLESIEELGRFVDLCRGPDFHSVEEVRNATAAVLYHAAGHLAQAARLYDYFSDPFGADKDFPKDG